MPAAAPAPARPDVFISYSRHDKAFVEGTLLPALVEIEKDVWIDLKDIPPASDWRARVLAGVAAANALVFVISHDSLTSAICVEELARAVELNKRIIPVLCRDPAGAALPPELARSNWVYMRDEDDPARGLALVIEALETDLEWRDAHSRLVVRAAEWLDRDRDRSFLLRGSDLSAGEAWLAGQDEHAERATPEQAGYIVASRQATSRRQRITLVAVLVALVIATLLAIYALIQRAVAEERARVATSRELAAQSLSILPRDPELAVLLAADGARRHPTTQAEDALRRALEQSDVAVTLRGHDGPISASFAGRDGLVVTGGYDHKVRVWNGRTGRSVAELRGHKDDILGISASPDGKRIVSAGKDGTARIWDLASGRVIAVLRGHKGLVYQPSFSPDGKLVLTAGSDGTARLWDAGSGSLRAVLEADSSYLFSARFDPSGERVLTAGSGGVGGLWRTADGKLLAVMIGHRGAINSATFSNDGTRVATGGDDATARVWSAASGRELHRMSVGSIVTGVAFSPDSRRLATAAKDSTGAVWSVRTGTRTADLRGHEDIMLRVVFTRDGHHVVSSSADDTARVWDARSGESVAVLRGHTDEVGPPHVSADGRLVLTASDDGTARIWRLPQRATALARDGAPLTGAALNADGSQLLTRGEGGVVRLFDTRSGKALRSFGRPDFFASDAAFLPGGRLAVAMAVADGRAAQVVDARTGRVLATMRAQANTRKIAVSRDGSRVVTAGLPPDDVVRVWDTASGRLVSSVRGTGTTASIALTPDGSRVIRGRLPEDFLLSALKEDFSGSFESWNAATGRLVAKFDRSPGAFSGASFSPDGRRAVLTTAEGVAPLWDMRSSSAGRVLRPRAQTILGQVVSVDWGATGNVIAVADRNDTGVVRVFGVARGDVRAELRHGSEVRGVALSRDGRWVVSAGVDGVARVWEVSSARLVDELRGHRGELVAAAFGPDARQVITASKDGAARVHECERCVPLAGLLKLVPESVSAGRRLTRAERQTFLHETG